MKVLLRKLCSPILAPFEKGQGPYDYKPLNRKILIFMGVLFSGLSGLSFYIMPEGVDPAYFLPVIVFATIGLVALIVGGLGSDRAVTKIWGSR